MPEITVNSASLPMESMTVADFFKKKAKKKKKKAPLMETKPTPYTLEDAHAAAEELDN